jgi:hypothetical protein
VSDLYVSLSELKPGISDQKEQFRVINKLSDQEHLRFKTTAQCTTDGAGTYKTIWSATIPNTSSWYIDTTLIGRGVTSGCSFEKCLAVQNYAGTVTVVGGTSQGTFIRRDAVAMDSKFNITGAVLSYEVRDDATQAMNWKVFVEALSIT